MDELRKKIAAEIGRANGRSSAMGNLVSPMTLLCAAAALRAIEEAGYVVVPNSATMVKMLVEAKEQMNRELAKRNLEEPRG